MLGRVISSVPEAGRTRWTMQANLTTFAAISLGALLAFFPIFNQVRDTSLDALAEGKAKLKARNIPDHLKELPDDERIDRYDGRIDAGEYEGEFDPDRVDPEGKYQHPDDRWEWKDPQDAEYADDVGEENVSYRLEERNDVVFQFKPSDKARSVNDELDMTFGQEVYDSFKITCDIQDFYGSFTLRVMDGDGDDLRTFSQGPNDPVVLNEDYGNNDCGDSLRPDEDPQQVDVRFDPTPALPSNKFEYTITGMYFVKVRV